MTHQHDLTYMWDVEWRVEKKAAPKKLESKDQTRNTRSLREAIKKKEKIMVVYIQNEIGLGREKTLKEMIFNSLKINVMRV